MRRSLKVKVSATPQARVWQPVQPIDILRWLGILFYMANHLEPNRQSYWQVSEQGTGHHLGQWMSRIRWEQIHRFLTFNPQPITLKDSFFTRLEPVASIIRTNCQNAVKSSLWAAVDEAIVRFIGRSKHKVQIPSKPILEGFEVWVLALQYGYIWSWHWHSKKLRVETEKFVGGEDLMGAQN